ncbi:MAG: nuclear transport factor 2 family protein [Tepidiformaceae bacterium]
MNARFIHNFVTNDVKSHNEIIHEEFVCITPSGARQGRSDYLTRWATGFNPEVIPYWDYRDECISIFGSVALVRSTNKHIIRARGEETTGMTTYTDTYIRDGDDWKCIQAQLTIVSPQHYPGDETIVKKYIDGVPQE